MNNSFLPTTEKEMLEKGWNELDIILVTGDAYVDHPSFGTALIGRFLESLGYRVGILDQPDVKDPTDIMRLGRPALFFGVSSGNMDSMINHYTAQKKIRTDDAYTPGGEAGKRPNRADIIYTQLIRTAFKDVKVVLGGIEASLRRIPHYDYWSDQVKNSILADSKADIIVYGMGENAIKVIAERLKNHQDLKDIDGTVIFSKEIPENCLKMPSFELSKDKAGYHQLMKQFYENFAFKTLCFPHQNRWIIHYPPAEPLSTEEMDSLYKLPFMKEPHPKYKQSIPAYDQINLSITAHRGCFGGCNFCAIGLHQGKTIQSRSEASIMREVELLSEKPYFKSVITDIGGPSANMYQLYCKANLSKSCRRRSCLYPEICSKLNTDHSPYNNLLRACLKIPRVKRIFISSGVRFDLALEEKKFIHDLASLYTSGHLKLAPEHVSENVLRLMYKPSIKTYDQFCNEFVKVSDKYELKQYVLPYLIVGHPGSTLADGLQLAVYLKNHNIQVKQIQEFTPTPLSISTTMYYTEMDFETGKAIPVPKGREIRLQKALAQWFIPENKKYVIEALRILKREDLIKFFLGERN